MWFVVFMFNSLHKSTYRIDGIPMESALIPRIKKSADLTKRFKKLKMDSNDLQAD